jgi:hypothetical protein
VEGLNKTTTQLNSGTGNLTRYLSNATPSIALYIPCNHGSSTGAICGNRVHAFYFLFVQVSLEFRCLYFSLNVAHNSAPQILYSRPQTPLLQILFLSVWTNLCHYRTIRIHFPHLNDYTFIQDIRINMICSDSLCPINAFWNRQRTPFAPRLMESSVPSNVSEPSNRIRYFALVKHNR